jgi:hypothetical protein
MSAPAFATATPSTRSALPPRRRSDGDEREGATGSPYPLGRSEARVVLVDKEVSVEFEVVRVRGEKSTGVGGAGKQPLNRW